MAARESTTFFTDMAQDGCEGSDMDMTPIYGCMCDARAGIISSKSDMWCLAQTAYTMWEGKNPPTNPVIIPKTMPNAALLQRCLDSDPDKRPSAREFLDALGPVANS